VAGRAVLLSRRFDRVDGAAFLFFPPWHCLG
jgi:hypothetical protein